MANFFHTKGSRNMKKTLWVRFLALALVLVMLIPAICSCKKGDKETESTAADTSAAEVVDTAEKDFNALNVLGAKDLGGDTVKFYLRSYGGIWDVSSLYADSILSDTINDAVYMRNEQLKKQYNFDIEMEESLAQFYPTRIVTQVMSGSFDSDVLTASAYDMTKIAVQGVLMDLHNIDALHLQDSWWNNTLNEQMTIANTLYYASGDLMCEDNMAVRCLYFNKTLANAFNFAPEDIYEMAKSGQWTMAQMFEMASQCYQDKDNVAGKSEGDVFGFTAQKVAVHYVFMTAANIRITEKDSNDVPKVVLGTGNDTDIVDRISTYLHRDDSVYLEGDGLVHKAFKSNSALFMTEVLGTVVSMRDWDVKFGILPMPKYSVEQANYHHFADGNCLNLLAIPTGINARLNTISFVLDAMCVESAKTLNPAFYDKCLRGRYAYDPESADMIDIILDSMFVENANLFKGDGENDGWGVIQAQLREAVNNGTSIRNVVDQYGTATAILIAQSVEKLKDISVAQSY